MTDSACVSFTNLRCEIQRGTKPMSSPMMTSAMTICAIRINRIGGGADEDEFEFMALKMDWLAAVGDAGA
jgi:hypothetical protein